MSVQEVGTIRYLASDVIDAIFWTVPSFSLLHQKTNTRIWSPSIVHYGNDIKRGRVPWVPPGFIGLMFYSTDFKEPPVKSVRFGIADMKNSEICCCDGEWENIYDFGGEFKVPKFVRVNILNRCLKSFNEKPRFRLFCEAVNNQRCQVVNSSTQTDNTRVADKDSKNSDKTNEENSDDLRSLQRLSENFQQLYIGSKDCDFTIQVQDRDFKVHRAILRARSSVFDAMFTHQLSESNSGIVPIEDCEPAVMEQFLFFIYSGRTQNLSSDNVCELYYVADKYNVLDLKEKCISFLKKSLTTEIICDVICLATKHNEAQLLELAITFFAKNMEEILVTVKWQVFLRENPTEANELYIKALKVGFAKINI